MKKNILTSNIDDTKAPLMEHLVELRQRLIKCILAIILGCVICAPFLKEIIEILIWPFDVAINRYNFSLIASGAEGIKLDLIATHPMETFFVKLKIALFGGIVLSFPILAYQFYRFIAPGLYKHEKKAFLPFLFATPILFFAGGAMVYYLIAPLAWNFFLSYQNMSTSGVPIRLEAKMGEYLSLMMRFIFAFGLAFQLPVVLGLMAKVGIVTYTSLKKFRKYAIVIAFLAAAFLTPPDPFSQISLALPIILLYEISIYIAKMIQKNKKDD